MTTTHWVLLAYATTTLAFAGLGFTLGAITAAKAARHAGPRDRTISFPPPPRTTTPPRRAE